MYFSDPVKSWMVKAPQPGPCQLSYTGAAELSTLFFSPSEERIAERPGSVTGDSVAIRDRVGLHSLQDRYDGKFIALVGAIEQAASANGRRTDISSDGPGPVDENVSGRREETEGRVKPCQLATHFWLRRWSPSRSRC
jgi:hypothetical protein